jgi:hypothetical protein
MSRRNRPGKGRRPVPRSKSKSRSPCDEPRLTLKTVRTIGPSVGSVLAALATLATLTGQIYHLMVWLHL